MQLTPEMQEYVTKIAQIRGISEYDALRGAIASEWYFQSKIKQGYRVLIENGKEIRDIIFR
jgi:hypothetical protein